MVKAHNRATISRTSFSVNYLLRYLMDITINSVAKILSKLIAQHDLNETELSQKIGVPRATINRLTSGRTPDPRASTLQTIANYFEVSIDQLLGHKPLFSESGTKIISEKEDVLPILEWNEADKWKQKIKEAKTESMQNWLSFGKTSNPYLFALMVRGESMWPQFEEGFFLVVDPQKQAKSKDLIIAAILESNEIVFRKIIIEDGCRLLVACNPIFPTITLNEKDKIIGTIIKSIGSFE